MIKNFENILISNTRIVYKPKSVYQLLNGGDGFAVQFLGKYTIPHLMLSRDKYIAE